MRAVADDLAARADHPLDVGGGRANTAASRAVSAVVPASRTPSSPTVTRSASRPGSIAPASGQPSAAWPFGLARSSSAAARWRPRLPVASRSSSSTARASSNVIDDRVRVGAQCQRRARLASAPGGADPVGQIALCGRAQAAAGSRPLPNSGDVGLVDVGRVHGGEPLAQRPGALEHGRRAGAVGREQASFSAGCSETWA